MNSSQNWYQTFFNGVFLELWQKAMPPEYTNAEIKFIKDIVNIANGSNILDVPCGYGRHSIPLAKEGFTITGIDISEAYINQLKDSKTKMQLPITTIHADIIDYQLSGTFDLAICLGNSFNYFDYQPTLKLVKKINGVLKKGDFYVIHTGTLAESILPTIRQKNWMEVDDILFLTETTYHTHSSVLQSDYQIIKEGKTERRTAYHYVYTLAEMRRIFTEAGFHQIEVYCDFDKSVYKLGDKQAYIFAQK